MAAGAARQWGNVTHAQLLAVGFTKSAIHRMCERSELHPRHRGGYAWGHVSPAPESTWAAALLAAGPGAALSHTAVLAAKGLIEPRGVTEVTAPTQRRGDEALRVHVAQLRQQEITHHKGLRATTIARALLAVAAQGWPIDRLTHQAAASGLTSLADLRQYADASKAKGVKALRAALALPHTRSGGEERLRKHLEARGLPAPEMNFRIDGMTVDGFYPELGVVIELDHPDTHGSAFAQRVDAHRDARHDERGRTVLRLEEGDFAALADEIEERFRAA